MVYHKYLMKQAAIITKEDLLQPRTMVHPGTQYNGCTIFVWTLYGHVTRHVNYINNISLIFRQRGEVIIKVKV